MVTFSEFPSSFWPRGEEACTPVLRRGPMGRSTFSPRQGGASVCYCLREMAQCLAPSPSGTFLLLSPQTGSFARPLWESCGFQHHPNLLELECLIPGRRDTDGRPPSLILSVSWAFHLHLLLISYFPTSSESRIGRDFIACLKPDTFMSGKGRSPNAEDWHSEGNGHLQHGWHPLLQSCGDTSEPPAPGCLQQQHRHWQPLQHEL